MLRSVFQMAMSKADTKIDPVAFFGQAFPDILDQILGYVEAVVPKENGLLPVPFYPLHLVSPVWNEYISSKTKPARGSQERIMLHVARYYFDQLEEARKASNTSSLIFQAEDPMPSWWMSMCTRVGACLDCVRTAHHLQTYELDDDASADALPETLRLPDGPVYKGLLTDTTLLFFNAGRLQSLCGQCKGSGDGKHLVAILSTAYTGLFMGWEGLPQPAHSSRVDFTIWLHSQGTSGREQARVRLMNSIETMSFQELVWSRYLPMLNIFAFAVGGSGDSVLSSDDEYML